MATSLSRGSFASASDEVRGAKGLGRVGLVLGLCAGAMSWAGDASAQAATDPSASSSTTTTTSGATSDGTTSTETTTTTSTTTTAEPAPPVIESPSNQCVPSCAASETCVNGHCDSICNPACSASEVCTESGQCERVGKLGDSFAAGAKLREEKKRETSLIGVRALAGLAIAGGASIEAFKEPDGSGVDGPVNSGSFYAALKLGMTIDVVELSAEWAPGTNFAVIGNEDSHFLTRPRTSYNNESLSSVLMNIGVHLPLTQRLSWPVRAGGGFVLNKDTTDFIARLDIFGISYKTKYVLLDVSLPSLRYTSDFDQYHRFSGLVGLTASYITP
jgi:hypothetical protein